MMLKSIYFLTFLLGVQCRIRARPWESPVSNLLNVKTKNGSDIPPDGYLLVARGRKVLAGQFPWMTSIDTETGGGSYMCGGSLISDRHVLTAAHCIKYARSLTDVVITVGDYDRENFPWDCDVNDRCTPNYRTYPARIIQNENYDPSTLRNDIAILRLRRQIKTVTIRPISLPPFDVDDPKYENTSLTVAGWGLTEKNDLPNILLATDVNLKTRNECYKIHYVYYPRGHLCAGNPKTRTSSCIGDSGGPLMMYYKKKFYVSGIVSFNLRSETCGTTTASYYTNVFKYLKWIKWAMTQ